MTAVEFTFIVGLVVAPLVSLLKREHWNDKVKFAAAVAVAALVGVGQLLFGGSVHTFSDFVANWGTALAGTQAAYHLYFKDSKLDNTLTAIGVAKPTV